MRAIFLLGFAAYWYLLASGMSIIGKSDRVIAGAFLFSSWASAAAGFVCMIYGI